MKAISRCLLMTFSCCLMLAMTACIGSDANSVAVQSVEMEKGGISQEDIGKILAGHENDSIKGDNAEDSSNDILQDQKKTSFQSLEELFFETDPNWSEDAGYQEAVTAYHKFVGTQTINWIKENIHYGHGDARFMIGYVDEDDVPELFLCYDTVHVDGVHVFTYLPETMEIVRVGEFSSFGGMTYSYKKNRIKSQYGNQGFYRTYVSSIKAGRPELIDMGIIDGGGVRHEEVVGYYGFNIPNGVDGSHEGFYGLSNPESDIPDNYEDYLISETEIDKIIDDLMGNPSDDETVWVNYDNMYKVQLANEGYVIK